MSINTLHKGNDDDDDNNNNYNSNRPVSVTLNVCLTGKWFLGAKRLLASYSKSFFSQNATNFIVNKKKYY